MKKLTFILAMMLMAGCSNSSGVSSTDLDISVKTNESNESTGVTETVEINKSTEATVADDKVEVQTKTEPKIEIEEERTLPMEIHVYSTDIPWDESGSSIESNSYTSISAALKEAIEGDTIIVHEGIYRETLNITKDNIKITTYENDYVLVTGNELVNNFVPSDMPGIYVADVPTKYMEGTLPYSQVFANGSYQNIARFPNYEIDDMMNPLADGSGYGDLINIYKPADTIVGFSTFANETLPDVDLTGGTYRGIHGKNRQYVYGTILSNKGNDFSFEAYSKNTWTASAAIPKTFHDFGFGFILHKNLIDVPGEWFVENRKLYYMPDGDINNLDIEMQVRKNVLLITNAENVTLENINFVAGNAQLKDVDNILVENCTFRYLQPFFKTTNYGIGASAQTGIYMLDANNTTFKDTYVGHSWGTGFNIESGNNNKFLNCIVEDIGWNGTFTAGVYINGENTYIEDCTFRDNGRFQIRLNTHAKFDIIHSLFERPMKMGEDAGAISLADAGGPGANDLKGSEIAYNIIRDFRPIPISAGNYAAPFVLAFYMENSDNYTIHHNLIYDLTDENFMQNHSDVDLVHKTASLIYFGPGSKAMEDPVKFYNNTAWNYMNNFQIWNIHAVNFDEIKPLGFKNETAMGSMDQGHFANNLLNTGNFGLNYTSKNFSADGKDLGYADIPENAAKSIATNDIDEFVNHVATIGYHFNPEANLVLDPELGAENYVDAKNGDFRLTENSPAKGAGIPIPGITSSENPDLGALEGSDRVLSAGSTLELPKFKEVR